MALTIDVQIRFKDLDGLGHVNNAVYLSYCEMARLEYFRRHFDIRNAADFEFILARAELDFMKPLGMLEAVQVKMTVPRIGNTSWDFAYEVSAGGEVYCRARTVQVYFDYAAGAKAPVPEDLRKRLELDGV